MSQVNYVFNQLVQFIPKDVFKRLVKKYCGNYYVKKYTCWCHLLVMVWAQLTGRRSLRDIETSLKVHSNKLYRMGIGQNVSRSNIADANANRDVGIYREIAMEMMHRCADIKCREPILADIGRLFNVEGFYAVDSSTVTLNLDKFPWSEPQQGFGGVKLHTMLDLMRGVPRMCLITGHEERDQTFMDLYTYEPGCMYIFDRLYFKTAALYGIHQKGAYFITRLKRRVAYETLSSEPVSGEHVLSDVVARFTNRFAASGYPERVRIIHYYSTETNSVMRFVTNNFEIEAATIALLYKYRWLIELFFKWIKQHLRITSFYGTTDNAVMIQIYTAIVAFCTLALAADALNFKGSLYEFANLISVSLTERCLLRDLLARYNAETNENNNDNLQLNIFGP